MVDNIAPKPERTEVDPELVERVVLAGGDLKGLTAKDRVAYYFQVCQSLGLNPWTRPFDLINLQGKLQLYARRDATDQLRRLYNISITIVEREQRDDDIYIVTARGLMPDGRQDEATGAVSTKNLYGEAFSNVLMKAETKAKRRVTLSLVGLGWLDETEVDSIPGASRVQLDLNSGEILPEKDKKPSAKIVKVERPAPTETEPAPVEPGAEPEAPKAAPIIEPKANDLRFYESIDKARKSLVEAWMERGQEKNEAKKLADEDYYRILGSRGYEHRNEIRSREDRVSVYTELVERVLQVKNNADA